MIRAPREGRCGHSSIRRTVKDSIIEELILLYVQALGSLLRVSSLHAKIQAYLSDQGEPLLVGAICSNPLT